MGVRINSRYFFKLKLKSPSTEALNTNFKSLIEDVNAAIEAFNARFRGIKEIILPHTDYSVISLIMVDYGEIKEQITAKELTFFSRYLHNEKDWVRFTKERTKLFIPIKIAEFSDAELFQYIREFNLNPSDYEEYFNNLEHDDDYFDELEEGGRVNNDNINDQSSDSYYISDEQMLATLKSLVMNKDVGSEANKLKKHAAIEKVKKAILSWIIN